ncbi:hypothetical protein [Streptomyces rubiginosohelvolus]|uniref:hypothetical protein n=1 Tax=Streptomyces rubiginosohelvolus TaxID=67362 RepID=UPI0034096E1B
MGAILCLALIAIMAVWTIRTTGLRGAFWLMSPSKIVALGTDPALRGLYYSELDVPGIQ